MRIHEISGLFFFYISLFFVVVVVVIFQPVLCTSVETFPSPPATGWGSLFDLPSVEIRCWLLLVAYWRSLPVTHHLV